MTPALPATRCTAPGAPVRRRCARIHRRGPPNPAGLWRHPFHAEAEALIHRAVDHVAAHGGAPLDPLPAVFFLGGWSLRRRACRDPGKRAPNASRGTPRACLARPLPAAGGGRFVGALVRMIDGAMTVAARSDPQSDAWRRAWDDVRAALAMDLALYADPWEAPAVLICTLPARKFLRLERAECAARLRLYLARHGGTPDEIARALDRLEDATFNATD